MGAQVIRISEYNESSIPRPMAASTQGDAVAVTNPADAPAGASVPEPASPAFVPIFERPEVQAWMHRFFGALIPPVVGLAIFVGLWSAVASTTSYLPGPVKTFASAVEVFSSPFYRAGPNDQGVGWNLLESLWRVAKGFGLAALIGIPLGFMLGRFALLNRAFHPIISVLRPVSPLAWLPIGLAIFQAANPAAIFVIFICSIWPMILNTALGVASVPQDYLNVARVLQLSEWKVFTRILLPASVPYVLIGAKLSLSIAWLAIVASEMLTGGVGIGFWLWDEWNNLNMEHILIAIGVIGVVGLVLEAGMSRVASRFDYRSR